MHVYCTVHPNLWIHILIYRNKKRTKIYINNFKNASRKRNFSSRFSKFLFCVSYFCGWNHQNSNREKWNQIIYTAHHSLIPGSQVVVVQWKLMFFLGCIEEELHKATPEGTQTPCFHAITKRLFEVGLKGIWSCNNFASGAENQSGSCLNCGGTDAMSGTFGEATGGEEADRKYGGREDRLREEVKEELGEGGGVAEGGWRRSRRCRGEERGSDSRESPTSAVTTTRLAAVAADCDCCSNKADSCHKHLLLNMTQMYAHL